MLLVLYLHNAWCKVCVKGRFGTEEHNLFTLVQHKRVQQTSFAQRYIVQQIVLYTYCIACIVANQAIL